MTTVIHHYEVINKTGFESKMKEFTRRFKVVYEVVWGTPKTREIEIAKGQIANITFHPCDVSFSFDHFKIDGFSYLGCIKDSESVGLFTIHGESVTKGMSVIDWIKSFRVIPCHACNRNHVRKIGHLFQEISTGTVKVFGSSCAKKYFGINFDSALSFFTSLNSKYNEWEESERYGFVSRIINTDTILKDIYYVINKYGYISKRIAGEEGRMSSSDMAIECYEKRGEVINNVVDIEEYKTITSNLDFTMVTEKSFTKDENNKSEFEYNVEVTQEKVRCNVLTNSDIGILTFLVWSVFFKPESKDKVEFVIPAGVVEGSKVENLTVTYEGNFSFNGSWGTTFINVFTDGNVRYKCFSSIDFGSRHNVDKGGTLYIKKATVKSIEDDPKYGKSVVITRPSVLSV